MKLTINGNEHECEAATLAGLLKELDYSDAVVATALNGDFISLEGRAKTSLRDGDRIEILAPMKGG